MTSDTVNCSTPPKTKLYDVNVSFAMGVSKVYHNIQYWDVISDGLFVSLWGDDTQVWINSKEIEFMECNFSGYKESNSD